MSRSRYVVTEERTVEVVADDPIDAARLAGLAFQNDRQINLEIAMNLVTFPRQSRLEVREGY